MISLPPAGATTPASPSLFDRAVDVINPLQHIPFVSFLYRQATGDAITPDANLAGGFLYGGPIGALGAAAGMIAEGLIGEARGGDVQTAWAEVPGVQTPRTKFIDPWSFNK